VTDADTAGRKVRRYTLLERVVVLSIVVCVLIGMGTSWIALVRQNDIREGQEQVVCIARLTADFQAAVGDALAAPPAPNTARLEAVQEIARTSRRLHAIEHVC
jgi:hypothetical protein